MTEEHLKKISLFFFLLTLDEVRAKVLSNQCWVKCCERKNKNPKMSSDSILLLVLSQFWEKLKDQPRTGVSNFTHDAGWVLPTDVKIEPWLIFHKTSTNEEMWTTLLCQVLRVSPSRVSESLGISQGTIRYRLARSVRRMGRIVLEQGGFI